MVSANLPEVPILIYDLQPAPGASTYAQRAKVVLKEKGIPYKVELINKLNKPQEFLDLFCSITSNPEGRGTVPIIVDGDVKLTESHVISEYLDTAYPNAGPKLFPLDAKNLAKVKLFVELYTAEVQPASFKILKAESQEAVDNAKKEFMHGLTMQRQPPLRSFTASTWHYCTTVTWTHSRSYLRKNWTAWRNGSRLEWPGHLSRKQC